MITFQWRAVQWLKRCFGRAAIMDRQERGDRLLEEVIELLQSSGYPQGRVPRIVEYVYSRPVGEPFQEVGGVMMTLAAYCHAHRLDMHLAGDEELERVWNKIDEIQEKQKSKPKVFQ